MQHFLSGLLYSFETPEDALMLATPKDVGILTLYYKAVTVFIYSI